MDEVKKVPFYWEFGEETVSLEIGMYANTGRLHIEIITHTKDGPEPFAAMTVNLPAYSLELGKVLPYKVHSGFGTYSVVSFDLNKLKEFDPKGVAEFKKAWNISDKKPVRKKNREIER